MNTEDRFVIFSMIVAMEVVIDELEAEVNAAWLFDPVAFIAKHRVNVARMRRDSGLKPRSSADASAIMPNYRGDK